MPEVSVVIPTRNRWHLLADGLRSVLAQERVEIEVLIVDDASSDETSRELAAIADGRLRVFRHDRQRGVAPARNQGVREASGEWLAFLDDDDVWAPRKLRTQLDAAARNGADFVYGAAVHVDEHRRAIKIDEPPPASQVRERLLRHNAIPAGCSNVLARTELVRAVGGFDERLFHLADWDLWLRLVEAGRPAASGEVLVAYVKHAENMLTDPDHDVLAELRYLAEKHRSLSDSHGVAFDSVGVSRWIALNHRRAGRRRDAARAYMRGALEYRNAGNAIRAVGVLVGGRPRELAEPAGGGDLLQPDWLEAYR